MKTLALLLAASLSTSATVIAIMTFLAGIAGGGAQVVAEAASQWTSLVAREATIVASLRVVSVMERRVEAGDRIRRRRSGRATRREARAAAEPA